MAKTLWMTKDSTIVVDLNAQVATAMRVLNLNARHAILQVANTSLRLQDNTNPADTDGGEVRLYALPTSPFCVNAWLASPYGDAAGVTDPDVFLRGDTAVGFDNQPLDWGWSEEADDD